MKVTDEDREYFQTYLNSIKTVFDEDQMSVILCEDKETGDIVPMLCRAKINKDSDNVNFTPMAVLLKENPFERFKPVMASEDSKEVGVVVLGHQGQLDTVPQKDEVSYFINNKNLN